MGAFSNVSILRFTTSVRTVALICVVLYLRKTVLMKICILYCLVPLNSVLFNLAFTAGVSKAVRSGQSV